MKGRIVQGRVRGGCKRMRDERVCSDGVCAMI